MGLEAPKQGLSGFENFRHSIGIVAVGLAICLGWSGTSRAELPASLDAYQGLTKTLYAPGRGQGLPWWSWRSGDGASRLATFCRVHGFSRVIVPIGSVEENWDLSFSQYVLPHADELASLAHTLRGSGIEPIAGFSVAKSPDNLEDWEHADDVLNSLHVFNVTYVTSRFEGLVLLQVPTAPDEEYLLVGERLKAKNGQLSAGLLLGGFVDRSWVWMDSLYGAPNALGDALLGLEEGFLHSAEPQVASDASFSREALSYAGAAGAVLSVVVDVSESSEPDAFGDALLEEDKSSFFDAVATFEEALRSHPHFGEIVLADYPSLFEALYGAPPAAYEGAISSLYTGGPQTEPLDWPSLNGEDDAPEPDPDTSGRDPGSVPADPPGDPDEGKSGSYVGEGSSPSAGLGGGEGLAPPSRESGCQCAVGTESRGKRVLRIVASLF